MREALALAAGVLGRTSPNPAVGCVIVKQGRVIARAATAPGRPSARRAAGYRDCRKTRRGRHRLRHVRALRPLRANAACADALIAAGIKRAVIGCLDPYPPVRGRGVPSCGAPVSRSRWVCWRRNAGNLTRDSSPGSPNGVPSSCSSWRCRSTDGSRRPSPARLDQLGARRANLAIDGATNATRVMVGAGTVIADDPRLTCRLKGGRDPIRIVVDAGLRTSAACAGLPPAFARADHTGYDHRKP